MQNTQVQKTLSVQINRNSAQRNVQWTYQNTKFREAPGELSFGQWQHLKIAPSIEIISDIEKNVGKLLTYLTLRESLAQLVTKRNAYQCKIQKDGIQGTSEIIAYHFKREYLDQKLCISHLPPIENLILVIVVKQLRAEPVSAHQASKAVFINSTMIPRWQCRTIEWTSQTKVENVIDYMDNLMSNFIVLNLKI